MEPSYLKLGFNYSSLFNLLITNLRGDKKVDFFIGAGSDSVFLAVVEKNVGVKDFSDWNAG